MNVRVSRIVADPAKAAADSGEAYKAMVERMNSVDGFLGACLLVDRATGNSLGLTFWTNEETLRASEETANQERAKGASSVGATTPPVVERFEVLYYGVPEPTAVE